MSPDLKALRAAVRAIEQCPPRMRRATLEYLWDRYVAEPERKAAGKRGAVPGGGR